MATEARIISCPACGTRNRIRAEGRGAPHCGGCGRPLPWMADADDMSFEPVAEASSMPVLVDFWAPWCGPCRLVSPAVERLAANLPGKLKVVKVNTDVSPAVSQRFDIRGIPTLVILRDGRELDRVTGAIPEPQLKQWVASRLTAEAAPAD